MLTRLDGVVLVTVVVIVLLALLLLPGSRSCSTPAVVLGTELGVVDVKELMLLLLLDSMLASVGSVAVLVLGEVLMMNSTDEGHAPSVVVVVGVVVGAVVVDVGAEVVDVARSLNRFSLRKLDLPYNGFV